jgi:hypothetical protein
MFLTDILETSHSPSFSKTSSENRFFFTPSTVEKTQLPCSASGFLTLSCHLMKEAEPLSRILWFEKMGMMVSIKNITQKHIYNLGSLYRINILDDDGGGDMKLSL